MSPTLVGPLQVFRSFPRVSGDEPRDGRVISLRVLFSPRERG